MSSGVGVIVAPDEPEQFASAILAMHENAKREAREMGPAALLTSARSRNGRNWLITGSSS